MPTTSSRRPATPAPPTGRTGAPGEAGDSRAPEMGKDENQTAAARREQP